MTTEPSTVEPTTEHREQPDGVAASTLDGLAADLRGRLVRPVDPDYDTTRAVFNGMIDRRPLAVVVCAGPSDVARGIAFAREHDLVLSVRGGGHSVAGNAVCDGGIMLDLSGMKGIRVDRQNRTARAEPGLTLGELDHETQAWGLATPLGVVSMTGIAGLTLGGGLGWLNGAYGLACDNLLSADVVTADGRLVTASDEANEDLYWGIRGGGGNFGVVTSFEYRLHPVSTVLAGGLTYPLAEAPDVLRFYDDFVTAAPDELSTRHRWPLEPRGSRWSRSRCATADRSTPANRSCDRCAPSAAASTTPSSRCRTRCSRPPPTPASPSANCTTGSPGSSAT